ncbi:Fanconi anemia group M protein [Methanomicrobium sp. W14]|uniref:DEAD/DEAH box helicase n=1 Tax=Methanomicrobium sp. W14 TaxID=2817839 RepID=UPI001AE3E486|nr:DEAD/DEAH box helicase [Methanomicrobium sp. W14]MBP2132138.1 Fanconi anemia group M protein [Methanomicrobium sp. W14]
MKYITHPLIKPQSLEERQYQLSIAIHAVESNTLVVLPTGLGKTAIALLCSAMRLKSCKGRVLVLAPTKPLVDQHKKLFSEKIILPENSAQDGFAMFTGETDSEKRLEMWGAADIILATPQVIKNDIIAGRYSLKDVSLVIFDECHRAVGNYAYVFIAAEYMKTAQNPLILGMTASPGSKEEKLMEVCNNLFIRTVETRTETDSDVRPYIHEREIKYVGIELPPELEFARITLKKLLEQRLSVLGSAGYIVPSPDKLSMTALNGINAQIQRNIQAGNRDAYTAASIHAEIMKIRHAITLAESQGSEILKVYLNKLTAEGMNSSGTKASKRLAHDSLFVNLVSESDKWEGELLPKFETSYQIVKNQLTESPESRIIIFANYRDTVELLCKYISDKGIEARHFIGQASKDRAKGLSQKKQIETLSEFREGAFRVLVATSVGEEGLDVPSTDLVIFYESVPSEIRSIQRKGRTGRHGSGSIIVLVTKGTLDETFTYVSRGRERSMKKGILNLSGLTKNALENNITTLNEIRQNPQGQATLSEKFDAPAFPQSGPYIIADDRESSSRVVECLHNSGAAISLERLENGDYAIGDRIVVERKTTRDFMDTLVERDLIGQIKRMADSVLKPVLIIEGDDLYSQRDVNPNAVRGALSAIAIGMGVSIFYTKTPEETADMLFVIANREEGSSDGAKSPHFHKSYKTKREALEYILSSFPGTGLKNARILLENFGTLENIIKASEEELKAVDGIGEKTASKIYEISRQIY